jgi:hypothetical protein
MRPPRGGPHRFRPERQAPGYTTPPIFSGKRVAAVKSYVDVSWVLAAMLLPGLVSAAPATTASKSSRELVKAVTHGDCDTAIRLANEDLQKDDAQAAFLVGRMVAAGVCVQPDGAIATAYFSHAAALGLPDAMVEYGVQAGLGVGVDQSYERAGDLCRRGGLEPQAGHSSLYSLGYVCTVRGEASRRLRESLPRGAFVPNSGVAQVSFNPVSGVMQIRRTPRVASQDPLTGTLVRQPLFDAQAAIDAAWKQALSAVPKPDATRLEDQKMDLTLDVDNAIDGRWAGQSESRAAPGFFLPGDVHITH